MIPFPVQPSETTLELGSEGEVRFRSRGQQLLSTYEDLQRVIRNLGHAKAHIPSDLAIGRQPATLVLLEWMNQAKDLQLVLEGEMSRLRNQNRPGQGYRNGL